MHAFKLADPGPLPVGGSHRSPASRQPCMHAGGQDGPCTRSSTLFLKVGSDPCLYMAKYEDTIYAMHTHEYTGIHTYKLHELSRILSISRLSLSMTLQFHILLDLGG